MKPPSAQYLLRFDDLCPTMRRAAWRRFLPLFAEFGLQPILAAVPDNRDPELMLDPPDPGFWRQMQDLQAAGATIGLHGYRHLCQARGRGLVPIHAQTEFAGAPESTQRQWIQQGMEKLRSKGLEPRIWVAPRHGFDRATLRALRAEGIGLISDGFAPSPFRSRGLTWIPQQLWAPVVKPSGLWTICLHANTATDEQVAQLRRFLTRHAEQFTSVDRVLAEWPARERGWADRAMAWQALMRIRIRRWAGR